MKALYITNNYSSNEISLIERVQQEMGSALTIVNLTDVPDMLKQFIRATPALIVVNDDLQGENLLADGVDGKLIATAIVAKRMEEEDLAIHQQETHRLDNLINAEKTKAIDDYTLSLINGGII